MALLGALAACTPIWAGPKLQIEVSGVEGDVLSGVRAALSIHRLKDDPLLSAPLIERLHRKAPAEIRRALQFYGYYRPEITTVLEPEAAGLVARYAIRPGDALPLEAVAVEVAGPGRDDPAFRTWKNEFPLQVGSAVNHRLYEEAKAAAFEIAHAQGYVEGRFTEHRLLADLDRYVGRLTLRFDTGPRYVFGAVRFEHDVFAEEFLRRFLTFRQGEPYSQARLLALQRAYVDSDYFAAVDIDPDMAANPTHAVDIDVRLTAKKPAKYTVGAGFSTDIGPRVNLGVERRRLGGAGHRALLAVSESSVRDTLTAQYYIPLRKPRTDHMVVSVGRIDEKTDVSRHSTASVSTDINRLVGGWRRSLGVSYERERFRLARSDESRLLVPRASWLAVQARPRVYPRRGHSVELELRGAAEDVLSDTSFVQGRANARLIRPAGRRSRLLLRAGGGLSWTPALSELPVSQRFFAGGDTSVRGYDYQSLGPVDAGGTVTGGRHLAVASVEYDFALQPRWVVAVFWDAGNAFNGGRVDAQQGAGIGLRWRLPVGAARLDLASALSEPGTPWRVHITLGPDL